MRAISIRVDSILCPSFFGVLRVFSFSFRFLFRLTFIRLFGCVDTRANAHTEKSIQIKQRSDGISAMCASDVRLCCVRLPHEGLSMDLRMLQVLAEYYSPVFHVCVLHVGVCVCVCDSNINWNAIGSFHSLYFDVHFFLSHLLAFFPFSLSCSLNSPYVFAKRFAEPRLRHIGSESVERARAFFFFFVPKFYRQFASTSILFIIIL